MKVLLLVGILAVAQASGQYGSLLQRLGEREIPQQDDQKNDLIELIEILQEWVDKSENGMRDFAVQLHNMMVKLNTGNKDNDVDLPDNIQNGGSEDDHGTGGDEITGTPQVEEEDDDNKEHTPVAQSMRDLLGKIKSSIDETKREQSQTMSDALSRILKTLRRK